ncbi:hypothetical protein B0G75_117121 [Paraburkholderia sp. BL18I3N2]|nr:hypothetical protein B0G75_117121 [Paraburkholderia sp. BL18I3N2]
MPPAYLWVSEGATHRSVDNSAAAKAALLPTTLAGFAGYAAAVLTTLSMTLMHDG